MSRNYSLSSKLRQYTAAGIAPIILFTSTPAFPSSNFVEIKKDGQVVCRVWDPNNEHLDEKCNSDGTPRNYASRHDSRNNLELIASTAAVGSSEQETLDGKTYGEKLQDFVTNDDRTVDNAGKLNNLEHVSLGVVGGARQLAYDTPKNVLVESPSNTAGDVSNGLTDSYKNNPLESVGFAIISPLYAVANYLGQLANAVTNFATVSPKQFIYTVVVGTGAAAATGVFSKGASTGSVAGSGGGGPPPPPPI